MTSTAEAPAWSRRALIAIALLAGALMLSDVTSSGFGNTYYATGALAASRSWSALVTNAADLGGYVSSTRDRCRTGRQDSPHACSGSTASARCSPTPSAGWRA